MVVIGGVVVVVADGDGGSRGHVALQNQNTDNLLVMNVLSKWSYLLFCFFSSSSRFLFVENTMIILYHVENIEVAEKGATKRQKDYNENRDADEERNEMYMRNNDKNARTYRELTWSDSWMKSETEHDMNKAHSLHTTATAAEYMGILSVREQRIAIFCVLVYLFTECTHSKHLTR